MTNDAPAAGQGVAAPAIPLLRSPGHRMLVGVLVLGSLVPIWSVTFFPSQNGPWHLLVARMLADYVAGTSFNYFDFYRLAPHLIPHLLHTALVALLSLVLPLLVAHQVVISLYAILLPLSVFYFLSTVSPRNAVFGYASFLFVYNLPMMRGYHDYALGIPVVCITLAYWLRHRHALTRGRLAVLMGLIVLAFLSHVFHFLVLGLAFLVWQVAEARGLRVGRLLRSFVPFVPAGILFVDFAILHATNSLWVSRSDLEFMLPHRAAEHLVWDFFHTLSPVAAALAIVPFAIIVWGVVRSLIEKVREWQAGGWHVISESPHLALGVVLLAFFLATPYKFFGWHYANTRFIAFVLIVGLACISTSVGPVMRRAFVFLTAVAAISAYGLLTVEAVRADGRIQEYLSGVNEVEINAIMYPVNLENPRIGRIRPLTRAYDYYQIYRGGVNGQGIAKFNTLTPLPYIEYPVTRRFPIWERDRPDESARRFSEAYDYVLAWGTGPFMFRRLEAAGFELHFTEGSLHLYRNTRSGSARAGGRDGS